MALRLNNAALPTNSPYRWSNYSQWLQTQKKPAALTADRLLSQKSRTPERHRKPGDSHETQ